MKLFTSPAILATLAVAGLLVGCNRDNSAAGAGAGPAVTTPPPVSTAPPADTPAPPASAASS